MVDGLLIQVLGRNDHLHHLLHQVVPNVFQADLWDVLHWQDHSVNTQRLHGSHVVSVLHGDLQERQRVGFRFFFLCYFIDKRKENIIRCSTCVNNSSYLNGCHGDTVRPITLPVRHRSPVTWSLVRSKDTLHCVTAPSSCSWVCGPGGWSEAYTPPSHRWHSQTSDPGTTNRTTCQQCSCQQVQIDVLQQDDSRGSIHLI